MRSNIQADNLSRRHLKLLIDTSLQVLVEQSLKLFILLVKQTGLFNEILAINQELVVFLQGIVKSFPN